MNQNDNNSDLAIISLSGSGDFTKKVNNILKDWRQSNTGFIIPSICPRFGTGEGKGTIKGSVREKDLYIIIDVCNHSISYSLFGKTNYLSPDDHYADLKRIIGACTGKPKKITIIMPFLYGGRQHKRNDRESLDCATMLQELTSMGVTDFITFDAHDARVQNSIPLNSFENIMPRLQYLETLKNTVNDIVFDKQNLVFISPDEGAIHRAIYFANIIGADTGMFYKRRDYSIIKNGVNPIVAHEYMGGDIKGKDVIVVDDMISSGGSMIDTCKQLKERGAKRIFVFATFGLFTNGVQKFDKAYKDKLFDKIFCTNLTYTIPELFTRPYYEVVKMETYVAAIIDTLNKKHSIAPLLDNSERVNQLMKKNI